MNAIEQEAVTSRVGSGPPSLTDARKAVGRFLEEAFPDACRATIIRLVRVEMGEPGWEADAALWLPNATIQSLGLETEHPVLDETEYTIRLDSRLEVTGYSIKSADAE